RRVGQEESWRPAVANYGLRPTFEQTTKPLLEVHLLNGAPYAQGDFLEIEWLRFLRPERRFSGPEELKAQIARDKEEAVNWFSTSQLCFSCFSIVRDVCPHHKVDHAPAFDAI